LSLSLSACGSAPETGLDHLSRVARVTSVVQDRARHLRATARLCLPPDYAGQQEAVAAIDAAFEPALMLTDVRASLAAGYPFQANRELLAELATPQNQAVFDLQLAALRAAPERLPEFRLDALSPERVAAVESYVRAMQTGERTRAYIETACPGIGGALRRLAYPVEQRARAVCEQQMQTRPESLVRVAAYQLSGLGDAQLRDLVAMVETPAFSAHLSALEAANLAAARAGIERLARGVQHLDATR